MAANSKRVSAFWAHGNFIRYKLFIIRRERVMSLIWLASLVFSVAVLAAAYPGLFPTQEALYSIQMGLDTPAMVAMMGPVYGMDSLSTSIAMAQECLIWLAIASIVMNIFFINRHTRVDEELGRHEMLISLPVGRFTGTGAAIVCAFGLNLLISLVSAFAILLINIDGTTTAGAFCYAFSIGAQGFLFAAFTLLAAQLFSTAAGSSAFSFALMGIFYIMRAAGDISGNALSYISPLGLGLKVEAFYTDAFWPLAVLFAEAVVITVIALAIGAKRDVGQGVIPARKGRANAGRFLQSPLGLSVRLTRSAFIIWAATMLILGLCYGTVVGELDKYVEGNSAIREMLESIGGGKVSLVESYIPMLCGIMAMVSCIPVAGAMNRLRAEEKHGRLEQIYSKAVSRGRMFICFAGLAVCEAVVFTFLSAIGLYAAAAGTGLVKFGSVMGAFFVHLPAILVMAALAALLLGVLPKLSAFVWALLSYSFLMLYFGRLFNVPDMAKRISPYGNVPMWPVEELKAAPMVILCVIAAVFFVAGYVCYTRRDVG